MCIGVGQVQILLDPKFKKAAKNKAFAALCNNLVLNDSTDLDPKTATLAIATEKVPMPDLKPTAARHDVIGLVGCHAEKARDLLDRVH